MAASLIRDIDCWVPHKPADLALSVFLILGIAISYAPQHLKIITDRSSKGISHWFLLLGSISSFANLSNAAILQYPLFSCCTFVPVGQCLGNVVAFIQLLVQWSMNFLMYNIGSLLFMRPRKYVHRFVLYFLYYPEEEKMLILRDEDDNVQFTPELVEAPGWLWSKRVCLITLCSMATIVLVSAWIQLVFGFPSEVSYQFSTILGVLSLVLSFFQFIPQIFKTYKLQEVGALSITAMLMQTPGSFMMCYTIAISPQTNVYTWITYFVGGCLQGCLLLLCIQLRYTEERRGSYERIESED